jgi:hypothetical protein
MARPLPTDRSALKTLADELAIAERAVAVRLAAVRALETVAVQARDPRFRQPEAQAHLAAELDRLRAILERPAPDLTAAGPLLVWPDRTLPPAEYLAELHRAIVRLRRDVADAPADAPAPVVPPDETQDRDRALRATIDAIDDRRSSRSVELLRTIGASPDWTIDTDEALRVIYRLSRQDRRGLSHARRTGAKLIRRLADRLDGLATPLRIELTGKRVRLVKA